MICENIKMPFFLIMDIDLSIGIISNILYFDERNFI